MKPKVQVAIGEHDTLGKSGGSRSVVEHGYIVVVHDGVVHIVGEESLFIALLEFAGQIFQFTLDFALVERMLGEYLPVGERYHTLCLGHLLKLE